MPIDYTLSANMNFPIPAVGIDPGPTWASDLNTALSILDQHDHTPGRGVAITPAGININTNLSFGSNSITNLKASIYAAVASFSTTLSTYVIGKDLYYTDGDGNAVRITQGGAVTGATGTITGLPSGTAGAAFSAGTFTFTSASLTGANIDGASFILRNNSASSFGLTLNPPAAMAANFALTLPSLPVSQSFMTVDTSGNITGYAGIAGGLVGSNLANQTITNTQIANLTIGAAQLAADSVTTVKILDANVTRAKLVAVGQQISSSSGTASTASGTYVDITNLTVTITTTGRPVMVALQPDGSGTACAMNADTPSNVQFLRGATVIGIWVVNTSTGSGAITQLPPGCFFVLDTPAAGTYTYKAQYKQNFAASIHATAMKMVAYEL